MCEQYYLNKNVDWSWEKLAEERENNTQQNDYDGDNRHLRNTDSDSCCENLQKKEKKIPSLTEYVYDAINSIESIGKVVVF